MTNLSLDAKFKKATGIICKQGMFPFPLSETAISIIRHVVVEEAELDMICAFKAASSQTMAQLKESSGFSEETIEKLTTRLAKTGLVFNQPSSSGVMVYRLLPLMMIGLMEYKFMTKVTGSHEERELAELFERLLTEPSPLKRGCAGYLFCRPNGDNMNDGLVKSPTPALCCIS